MTNQGFEDSQKDFKIIQQAWTIAKHIAILISVVLKQF